MKEVTLQLDGHVLSYLEGWQSSAKLSSIEDAFLDYLHHSVSEDCGPSAPFYEREETLR